MGNVEGDTEILTMSLKKVSGAEEEAFVEHCSANAKRQVFSCSVCQQAAAQNILHVTKDVLGLSQAVGSISAQLETVLVLTEVGAAAALQTCWNTELHGYLCFLSRIPCHKCNKKQAWAFRLGWGHSSHPNEAQKKPLDTKIYISRQNFDHVVKLTLILNAGFGCLGSSLKNTRH